MKNLLSSLNYISSIILFTGFFTTVQAQNNETILKQDTTIVESQEKYPVVTNLFWGNWFIGADACIEWYYGDHNRQMDLGERVSPAFEFYLGKWFSPGIGVRAGIGGFKIVGVTQNHSH